MENHLVKNNISYLRERCNEKEAPLLFLVEVTPLIVSGLLICENHIT